MTNIQDDQLINQYTDGGAQAPANDQQAPANNQQTPVNDQQTAKPKPSKADVDELLSQLEALHQEIAAKTVVSEAPSAEKQDEAVKLVAPPVTSMIESSDTPQLASSQAQDADLDKFINELEAKIAEKSNGDNQELSYAEKAAATAKIINQESPVINPEPPTIDQVEPMTQTEPMTPTEPMTQPEPAIKEETPHLQQINVEENFNQRRPSLDLSEVNKDEAPSLTLNNGQLEEHDHNLNKAVIDETPATVIDETPAAVPTITSEETSEEAVNAEDLESQNIFIMLGLDNLEQAEKEAFLTDLEKLIWDNFIDVELPLMLNTEEKNQAEQILADTGKTDDERKEALLVYLEKFIPDLEEVMYKKALSLKKDMFEERVNKMRKQASEENNLSLMADLDQIQELVGAGRYKTAVELLNKN